MDLPAAQAIYDIHGKFTVSGIPIENEAWLEWEWSLWYCVAVVCRCVRVRFAVFVKQRQLFSSFSRAGKEYILQSCRDMPLL